MVLCSRYDGLIGLGGLGGLDGLGGFDSFGGFDGPDGFAELHKNRLLVYQEPVFSQLSASSKSLAISCSSF